MDLSSIIDLRSWKNEENMRRNKRGEGRQEPSERRDERQVPRGETSVFNKSKFRGPMWRNYTEEVIRDVLLAGICDLDIRLDALSMPDILDKAVNDVVSIIESREMARNATPAPQSVAAFSSYKRGKQQKDSPTPSPTTTPCPDCQKPFLRYRERPGGGVNEEPYKQCREWPSRS